jgi:biotin operon repressor
VVQLVAEPYFEYKMGWSTSELKTLIDMKRNGNSIPHISRQLGKSILEIKKKISKLEKQGYL